MSKATNAEMNAIFAKPTFAEQLPYTFENGTCLPTFTKSCDCGKKLIADTIRGDIVVVNANTISLTGQGLCYDCHSLNPIEERISDDGTITARQGEQGAWVQYKAWNALSVPEKLHRKVKNLLGLPLWK